MTPPTQPTHPPTQTQPRQGEAVLAHGALRSLVLNRCNLHRLTLRTPALAALSMAMTTITAVGAAGAPALRSLDLDLCFGLQDQVLRSALTCLTALTSLRLAGGGLSDETLRGAAAAMQGLRELRLRGYSAGLNFSGINVRGGGWRPEGHGRTRGAAAAPSAQPRTEAAGLRDVRAFKNSAPPPPPPPGLPSAHPAGAQQLRGHRRRAPGDRGAGQPRAGGAGG